MTGFENSLLQFAEKAHRAAAQSRETLAMMSEKASEGQIKESHLQALRDHKNDVLVKWLKVVEGNIPGPTLFGTRQEWTRPFSDLYDALVTTISSKANPPNDAALVSFCIGLVARNASNCFENVISNTEAAFWHFEDVVLAPLQKHGSGSRIAIETVKKAVSRTLRRAEECLQQAVLYAHPGGIGNKTFRCYGDAMVAFSEAKDTLTDILHVIAARLPKAAPLTQDEDLEAIQKMMQMASEMEKMAERFRTLAPRAQAHETAVDQMADERRKHDVRLALVMLLQNNVDEFSRRWVDKIQENVYKTSASVSTEINRQLLVAMIEKLRPDGDAAPLVYVAQYMVEKRFDTLHIASVQAATRLFENVAMDLYLETKADGKYSKDLLPLLNAEDSDIHDMLADVALLAKKQIVIEYSIQVDRECTL